MATDRPWKPVRALLLLFAVGGALGLASCSSNDENDVDRKVGTKSIVGEEGSLPGAILTAREIGETQAGSTRRALLEYWRNCQFSAWAGAVAAYDRDLLNTLGANTVTEALKVTSAFYRTTKPRILAVDRGKGGTETVYFSVRGANGKPEPRSMLFERTAGDWRITYDSALDAAMQGAVQSATQVAVDPSATKASKRAVRAGHAASTLQSNHVKNLVRTLDSRR